MNESPPAALAAAMRDVAAAVEAELDSLLPAPHGPTTRLDQAMRYATLGGGKRLRALLAVAGGDLFGAPRQGSLRVAAAIEMRPNDEYHGSFR